MKLALFVPLCLIIIYAEQQGCLPHQSLTSLWNAVQMSAAAVNSLYTVIDKLLVLQLKHTIILGVTIYPSMYNQGRIWDLLNGGVVGKFW